VLPHLDRVEFVERRRRKVLFGGRVTTIISIHPPTVPDLKGLLKILSFTIASSFHGGRGKARTRAQRTVGQLASAREPYMHRCCYHHAAKWQGRSRHQRKLVLVFS
jgi:hypothetical protein